MKSRQWGCRLAVRLLIASLVALAVTAGSLVIPRKGSGNAGADCEYCVCAVQFGYHSALILPVETDLFSWRGYLNHAKADSGKTRLIRYLGFGWGERHWYVNPPTTHKTLESLRALFLPNRAVIKVERYAEFPHDQLTACIGVTPLHYLQLVEFIQQTFQRDVHNQPIYIAEDQTYAASFYEATGTYSLFNNCNHWTAYGLRLAGVDTPLWSAHAAAIMRILRPTCYIPKL
jgi:uncharacterized protein (TIGR02117 family)